MDYSHGFYDLDHYVRNDLSPFATWIKTWNSRSSLLQMFLKIGALKIFANLQENTCVGV